ncbi:MAG: CpaF family protein [Magnetovibrionaceae bacterium]
MFGRRGTVETHVFPGPEAKVQGQGSQNSSDRVPGRQGTAKPGAPAVAGDARGDRDPAAAQVVLSSRTMGDLKETALERLETDLTSEAIQAMSRKSLADEVGSVLDRLAGEAGATPNEAERRDLITAVMNELQKRAKVQARTPANDVQSPQSTVIAAKDAVQAPLLERIDVSKAIQLPRDELARQIGDVAAEVLAEQKRNLNLLEQRDLVTLLLHDLLGLGPLEPLLADDLVTDIMVNGPRQVYVERKGKLELSAVQFRDDAHVMQIATRIVTAIGRRVDESTPLVDARLADGSRVNIIIPPLAIDGPSISIRKFAKKKITLDKMIETKNLSENLAKVLKIASRARLNILISGGTGSGKTTLLNAMSRMIDESERIVTIEDAAELQLQQPHVVRLETRPPNLEGEGEITQRELVKNCLRMRPDRIILGEIRAGEALDMLQAMNTGHDGSMCTIHANRPREALVRLENMVAMAGVKLPNEAVRSQIAGAVNLVVQIARMRDGIRRITQVTEIVGMEGEIITTQDLFTFKFEGEDENGHLKGSFVSSGLRPAFLERADYFGLGRALMDAMGSVDAPAPAQP